MKYAIHLLLIFTLAVTPWACSGDRDAETVVSANTDNRDAEPRAEEIAPQTPRPQPTEPARLNPPPARDSAPARTPQTAKAPAKAPEPAPSEPVVTRQRDASSLPSTAARSVAVPAGTAVTVVMTDFIGTDRSHEGQVFEGTLAEPLAIDGRVAAERGTKVQGRVENIEEPGKVKGRAQLDLVLTQITIGNRTYDFETEPFTAVAADNKERDAAIIAGGAGVGAAIGAVAGGKKGAVIGAVIGGGSGTTAVLITPGDHLKIEPETRIRFVLEDDVVLPVIRNVIS